MPMNPTVDILSLESLRMVSLSLCTLWQRKLF